MNLSLILAVSDNNAIGINNKLPWAHIREDMLWFKANTSGKPVVMGSSTWDSLPFKPLPNRANVVLTSRDSVEGADLVLSGEAKDIMAKLEERYSDEVVIMGGAKVYNDFAPYVTKMYISRVQQVVEGDTFLDIDLMLDVLGGFKCTESRYDEVVGVIFEIWEKD